MCSDDDAFLRGLLVSMGATEFDPSTVDCLRQIAIGWLDELLFFSGVVAV